MKNRGLYWRRYKIQETLYIGQWHHLSPLQSGHLGTSHSSPSCSAALLYFPESHWWSEISCLSKVILVWEKPEVAGCQICAAWVLSHLGDLMFHKKNCLRHYSWASMLSWWWSCQLPVAHSCGLLNHLNGFQGGMFKLNAKLDADLLLCSFILNAMATQHTCSLNSIYCPHWLVQWSCRCSCMRVPIHSPWLPGYIDVMQTILIILTMAGLFLDRPHPFIHWKHIYRVSSMCCALL